MPPPSPIDLRIARFPATRYQGSKRRLLGWIAEELAPVGFSSVADPFGGTGAVSYLFKAMGKRVHYNDRLEANRLVGEALVANDGVRLEPRELAALFVRGRGRYDDFIERTFRGIFFTDEENRQLDVAAQNLARMPPGPKRALAAFALFQACLAKRPYNLFHRANLYMREADVERSFGNKATWDRPIEALAATAAAEANAAVFDNGQRHRATAGDALEVESDADLVYLDPPYVSGKGVGTDYLDFYHFLEGLSDYATWPARIDWSRKHRPMVAAADPWTDPDRIAAELDRLVDRWKGRAIAISYRSDGIPSIEALKRLLQRHGLRPRVRERAHRYVLSTNRRVREVLLVAA